MKSKIASCVSILLSLGMCALLTHQEWKTSVDASIASLKQLTDNPVSPDCVPPEQSNPAYATWLSDLQLKVNAVNAHAASMPATCYTPPTSFPGWLIGKSWHVGQVATVPLASQASGCCWHRGRNTITIINESNQLIEVTRTGVVIRRITLASPSTTPDFEAATIVSEGIGYDKYAIGHEGIGYGTPPTVTAHVLVVDIPNGTTDISINLTAAATKLDLPAVGSDYEALSWHAGTQLFHWVRQDASNGTLTLGGALTVLPRQNPPRWNTNDSYINVNLTPNPLWFGQYRYLQERDIAANSVVASADIGPLIGAGKWEGFCIDDFGSIFIVGELATNNFYRLDLN